MNDETIAGDSEIWGLWEAGLVLVCVAVGMTGFITLGWAVERFILS